MRDTLHAFRLALRALARTPSFTLAAIFALSLGIGGSTVVFSVVDAMLLRPLPYANPDRVVVSAKSPPWALYQQWRTANVFQELAVYAERAVNVAGAGEPERVMMGRVTPDFLSVVGVQPVLGRPFGPAQSEPGGDKVVLLTDAFWRKHFGSRADVVGRMLQLDDQAYTVVGVLPRRFQTPMQLMPARGLSLDWDAAVLVPLTRSPGKRDATTTDMFFRGYQVIGRLRPGVTLEQARAAAATIQKGVTLPPVLQNRDYGFVGLTEFVGGTLPVQMAILAAAVALLLLVAIANVANLLLARGTGRHRELATRAALGASPAQLVRHSLVETVALGAAGGTLGVAAAWAGVKVVSAFGAPVLARLDAVALDLRVLAFTCVLSLAVGLVVGVLPALRLARVAPVGALRVARGFAPGRRGITPSSLLVVVEVVLSLVLLVGAGLLTKDFVGLASADLGYRSTGVLTADISLSVAQYPEEPHVRGFFGDLLERASALPGVRSAALSSVPPAGLGAMSFPMRVEGATRGPSAGTPAALTPESHQPFEIVDGDYFRTLSIPIVEGRRLDARDGPATERVAVVNAAFARAHWNWPREAIGHHVVVAGQHYAVVGVSGDVRGVASATAPEPLVYFALSQSPMIPWQMTVLLSGRGDASGLAGPLARLMRQVNPNQPLYNVRTLDYLLSTQLARRRLIMTMMAVFAALALLLAAAGVYGVLSYAVAQRAHELGVRMAVGGTRGDVFSLVLGRGMRLVATGVAVGLPVAYAVTRVLAAQLLGITRTDTPTYVMAALLVALLGLLGCAVPAWRATRVDPLVALGSE